MNALLLRSIGLFAVLIVGTSVLVTTSPRTASLAGDVGLQDVDVCRALESSHAIDKLDASGFPHATTSRTETYRLVEENDTGRVIEGQVLVDWGAHLAQCLPLTFAGPVDATFVLKPKAYDALVATLQHVAATGQVRVAPGTAVTLAVHSRVEIAGNDAFDGAYKRALVMWAAGAVARQVWKQEA